MLKISRKTVLGIIMEGPSLFLAAQQLKPFVNKTILEVRGNTKIGKERLLNQKVLNIFSWGKHLVFQFDDFAMRVHFMLYGSFEAIVRDKMVTGDYPRKNRPARMQLIFNNGEIIMYSCSLRFIESADARDMYDFSIDIMAPEWDENVVLEKMLKFPNSEIADVLLDQTIFAGVGNIIKNEVLSLEKTSPFHTVDTLSDTKLKKIIKAARTFSFKFYKWRKSFVLKKHYTIYRKSACPYCKGHITRKKTGLRQRISFFCENCQK